MTDKYQNKYRIPSARLQNWDYGANGAYFITICTHNREHYFGEIINGEMILNELGRIVETEWMKTIEIRPDMNLEFGEFVVMPNHFHAIIIIGKNEYNTQCDAQRTTYRRDAHCTDAMHRVSTIHNAQRTDAMHRVSTIESINKFGPQSKNLASIIRGFKSAVTTNARKIHADFAWQFRFHDHIIRNTDEFNRIQTYIANNPQNWDNDKFHEK